MAKNIFDSTEMEVYPESFKCQYYQYYCQYYQYYGGLELLIKDAIMINIINVIQ